MLGLIEAFDESGDEVLLDIDGTIITPAIQNQERGYSSLILVKELEYAIISPGTVTTLKTCREQGITCWHAKAVYPELAGNLNQLLYGIENIFITTKLLRAYREEFLQKTMGGRRCPLPVLNSIVERILSMRISDEADKQYAEQLIAEEFETLRTLYLELTGTVNTIHYIGYRGGPIIGFGTGFVCCNDIERLYMEEALCRSVLPPVFHTVNTGAIVTGDTVAPSAEITINEIHGLDGWPDRIEFLLLVGYDSASVVSVDEFAGLLYISNLYMYMDREVAKKKTAEYLSKALSTRGFVSLARYGNRVYPLIGLKLEWNELLDEEDAGELSAAGKIVRMARLENLTQYPDLYKDTRKPVRMRGYVYSIETPITILMAHAATAPEPLTSKNTELLKKVLGMAEKEVSLGRKIRRKRRSIIKNIEDAGDANTLVEKLLTSILNL